MIAFTLSWSVTKTCDDSTKLKLAVALDTAKVHEAPVEEAPELETKAGATQAKIDEDAIADTAELE